VAEATYGRGRASPKFEREAASFSRARPTPSSRSATAPASAAFVRDLRATGYSGIIAVLSFADADNVARYLRAQTRVTGRDYLSGLVFSQVVPSYDDERLPAARLYRQAMARSRAGLPPQLSPEEYTPQRLSFVGFEGFLAGMALGEAVKRMHGEPTRGQLRTVFDSMKNVDLAWPSASICAPATGRACGARISRFTRAGALWA